MGELFISNLQSDPRFFFAVIITVVISITLHELAHGWIAILHGDDTPLLNEQMTLNPTAHIPPMAWLLMALMGLTWGRMYIDPTKMRGKYADALVAVAGPVTNLLLSGIAVVALGLWERFAPLTPETSPAGVNGKYLLFIFAYYNLLLAVLNMIPIPPLDGSTIVSNIIPAYRDLVSRPMAQGLTFALLIALLVGGGRYLFPWAFSTVARMMAGISGLSEYHFYVIRFPELMVR